MSEPSRNKAQPEVTLRMRFILLWLLFSLLLVTFLPYRDVMVKPLSWWVSERCVGVPLSDHGIHIRSYLQGTSMFSLEAY